MATSYLQGGRGTKEGRSKLQRVSHDARHTDRQVGGYIYESAVSCDLERARPTLDRCCCWWRLHLQPPAQLRRPASTHAATPPSTSTETAHLASMEPRSPSLPYTPGISPLRFASSSACTTTLALALLLLSALSPAAVVRSPRNFCSSAFSAAADLSSCCRAASAACLRGGRGVSKCVCVCAKCPMCARETFVN